MSLVAQKKTGFAMFRLPGIVSGSFQSVLARYSSFRFLQETTSPKKLTHKFTINQRHVRFYYKVRQALLQTVKPLMYYKEGQLLLKIGAEFFCYKVGQVVL